MKKTGLFIIGIFTLILSSIGVVFAESNSAILYYGNGCPHCAKVEEFIQNNDLKIDIEQKEIYQDKQNAEEFNEVCDKENIDLMDRGVPFLYSEGQCFIGDKEIISYFQETGVSAEDDFSKDPEQIKKSFSEALTLPVLIGAAFVDSINPCAFAVLLILMTTILASGDKKRALSSGIAYSISIFTSYFLMGIGLYSIISSIGTSTIFIKTIGVIAIILGLFNLKDFFWYGKFFIMEVPLSWRPRMKLFIKSITGPISAFLMGFLVSLFLLPCTSGPYIVIIGMLGHSETYLKAIGLLVLYNLIFVLPMVGITIGVYFGMDVKKAEEKRAKNLRVLHLIAGIIMLGMGIVLLAGF